MAGAVPGTNRSLTHASNNDHEKESSMPRLSTYDSDIANQALAIVEIALQFYHM